MDPLLIPQRFFEYLPQRDPDVFDGMVVVYIEVALTGEGNVHATVTGQKVQHMVKESDAASPFKTSCPIDSQTDGNIRLACRAAKCGFSHASASRNTEISTSSTSFVVTEMRKPFGMSWLFL